MGSLLLAGTAFADQGDNNQGGGEGHGWAIGSMIMAGLHMGQHDQNQGDQNENDQNQNDQNKNEHGMKPAVVGTVSAVSGTTLTVTAKGRGEWENGDHGSSTQPTPATFTVDASNATVLKGNATSSVSSVAVGDTVIVLGSISGTNITATTIRDGVPMGDRNGNDNGQGKDKGKHMGQQMGMPSFQGNGQPIVGGTVTAVGSTTITITNKSNVSFTVNASGAVIRKGNATSSLSSITVGDNVLVQGTINGNSVVASTIIDQSAQVIPGSTLGGEGDHGDNNASSTEQDHGGRGLGNIFHGLGGIGNFFRSLFGF